MPSGSGRQGRWLRSTRGDAIRLRRPARGPGVGTVTPSSGGVAAATTSPGQRRGAGCGNPGTERRRRGGGDHTPGRLAPGLQPIPAAEQADARPNRSPSVLRAPALFFESSRCLSAPCPLPARPHSALPRAACSELRSGLAPLRTYRVSSGARSDREVVSSWAQR